MKTVIMLGLLLATMLHGEEWTAGGVSMEPLIHKGQKYISVVVPFASLQAGDIVVYRNPFHHPYDVTTHQLVRKTKRGWVTKGVANAKEDIGLCTEKNFVGLVSLK